MATTYGTIPTAPSSSSGLEFISNAKEQGRSALSMRRPWKEMLHRGSLGFPSTMGEALLRIRSNIAYFRVNYAMITLTIIFLSLLWHPISLIVFIVLMVAWLFLFFLRDEPLELFHRAIDDRIVLGVLSIITIVVLLLTHVTLNIIVSLAIGVVIVVLHAALRKTEDLFVSEEEARLVSVGDSGKRPMSPPSSS